MRGAVVACNQVLWLACREAATCRQLQEKARDDETTAVSAAQAAAQAAAAHMRMLNDQLRAAAGAAAAAQELHEGELRSAHAKSARLEAQLIEMRGAMQQLCFSFEALREQVESEEARRMELAGAFQPVHAVVMRL